MRLKYLLSFVQLIIFFSSAALAQLSGIKTIPGDYATIAEAVAALNPAGVGSGGVTFNVAASHTENITAPILLTATGTSSNPILFQKSGAGANPKITRTDAGTLATTTLGGQGDAVIIIQGADYVTFDGISLAANNQAIEYGYYLRKASATDGCKNVTIKNAVIDMTKGISQYVAGIYSSNNDAASFVSSAVGITVTTEGGRHENITITGNTVQDVFVGILLRGFNHTSSPYNFYDQNFVVGENGAGNIIQNFAGNFANESFGVYLIHHNNANVSYNTINNTAGGGSNFTFTGYGIFHTTSTNGSGTYNNNDINLSSNTGQLRGITSGTAGIANLVANNNTIRLSQAGTSEASCIYFQSVSSGSSVTINNNTFSYGTFASTAVSYLIFSSNEASNVTVSGNQTGSINKTGAGELRCFSNAGSPTGGSALVQNNIFTNITLTGASTFYGIYYTGSTSQPKTISGNTISNITGGTSSVYGIFTNNDGAGTQIYSNTVTNISGTGTGAAVIGYRIGGAGSSAFDCFSNVSSNISCSGTGAVYGMYLQGASSSNYKCYSNNIYNIVGNNASSVAYGIYILSGGFTTFANIYNNFISEIKTPVANNPEAVYGIYVPGSIEVRLFFNTVYLNAVSSGANFGSNGIFYNTGGRLDMRNNNIINVSTPNGTGRTTALRMSNTSLNNYQTTSNNNCFYAGTPGPNNLIFFNGTNGDQTIAQFKTRVGPTKDAASFTEDVPFLNTTTTPYDLHVNTALATLTESGGIAVSSPILITDDYDGDTRNTTPDVGADEFAGTSTDPDPPVITYTLFERSGVSATRNLSGVSITDQRGVNTIPGTAPRVYYKKSTNANTFNDNTNTTNGWKWVEGTGVNSIFSFTLNYSLLFGGSGVSVGDVIQYFIIAQDLSPQQNVGINSGTFNQQPSSVNLVAANFPIGGTINSYPIVESISGAILVGSGQTFTTLTANNSQGLFKYINERVVAGNLTIRITSNILESGDVALNQTVDEGNNYITFQPNSASEKIIYSYTPAALIKLNGADRIIFDGRFEGSGNYLSFVNEGVSGIIAAIQIISLGTNAGARDITTRNCNISTGFNGFSSYAITAGGATIESAGDDNDNLTIIDNIITKSLYGININANPTGVTNNITITGNTIGSATSGEYIGKYGINIRQADNVNISGNTIFNIISNYEDLFGISISTGVTNAVISGNKIHSLGYTGTSGWGGIGIGISTSRSNANILIKNNLIYDIWGDGWDYTFFFNKNPFGIYLWLSQSGIMIYNNSINLYGNILNQTNAISVGIALGTGSSAEIKNNIVVNNLGLLSTTGYGSVGIFLESGSSQLVSSSNNLIYVNPSGTGVKNIGQIGATGYSTIQAWRTATGKDIYSFSSDPAFTSDTNLLPDNTNPGCWAANNKGMPLSDVSTDFNGNPRSTSVANGPVDIGAYEFSTSTTPPAAAQGGSLANNQTTTYSVNNYQSGSITWGANGTVPSGITFRYYTGIEPPKPNNPGQPTSKSYWDITNTGGSGFTYNVTFNYDEAQIGSIVENNLRLARSDDNGLNWIPYLISGTGPNQYQLNTSQNNITVYGLTSFSLFTLTDSENPLPVELNSFTAIINGRDINLKWETETEVNNYGFEIERSEINPKSEIRNPQFTKIGFVAGYGNSNSPKHYSFTDNNLNSGKYIYRLKMVDTDGSFSYSFEVESEIGVPKEYLLTQNYPNPFNPTTTIQYQIAASPNPSQGGALVSLKVYDILGSEVETLVNEEQVPGYYEVQFNGSGYASGMYIYRLQAGDYISTKKMLMLK